MTVPKIEIAINYRSVVKKKKKIFWGGPGTMSLKRNSIQYHSAKEDS